MSIYVERLALTNFRNYEQFEISAGAGENIVITGDNGVGKTNILEAISLLVPGRGLRNAKLGDFERKQPGENFRMPWTVFAAINSGDEKIEIGTGSDVSSESDKRIVKIDGELQRGQASLAKYFAICYLTPQMDKLFAEGVSERRYYLDKIVSGFYPEYISHLSIYRHAKSERQKLLVIGNADEDWLKTLENRMAEKTVAIAAARIEAVEQIQKSINNRDSVFPKAILSIKGDVEDSLRNMSALQAEEDFAEKLRKNRNIDAQTGRTTIGTHTSSFIVFHDDKGMPAELCSTGEQKALLISITLAVANTRRTWLGSAPVMLLDEIIAHLDSQKRGDFFAELKQLNTQNWITGTHSSFFKDLQGKAVFLNIENKAFLG